MADVMALDTLSPTQTKVENADFPPFVSSLAYHDLICHSVTVAFPCHAHVQGVKWGKHAPLSVVLKGNLYWTLS